MIKFKNLSNDQPYQIFYEYYIKALKKNQDTIEAISISSYDKSSNQVDSRYVNLKYIFNNEWIFFSNYNSSKANQFASHNQISALLYWNKINLQIRLKAEIFMTSKDISDNHFKNRDIKKNALSISSNQSKRINSFSEIEDNYKNQLSMDNNLDRPNYWGGFSFVPYYFEFWEGREFRLNKRNVFKISEGEWEQFYLQP